MFTGIIEEIGTIIALPPAGAAGELTISCKKVLEGTQIGDSIAVNGICLTVTRMNPNSFTADAMPETIRRSSLSRLNIGSHVNLERAMPMNGRFGGHIVSGHIDGTGTVTAVRREANAVWYRIEYPPEFTPCIIEKGSVAIDGISLTVAETGETPKPWFSVSIIPHTIGKTILGERKPEDLVNLETDVIGKYVQRNLDIWQNHPRIRTLNQNHPRQKNDTDSATDQEWKDLLMSL